MPNMKLKNGKFPNKENIDKILERDNLNEDFFENHVIHTDNDK